MKIEEAQRLAIRLARLAASAPDTEEGRSAGAKACKLMAEHGLMIVKPSDVVHMPAPPSSPASVVAPFDPRRIGETAHVVADTVVSGLGAASKIASALNGFKRVTATSRGRTSR